MIEIIPANIICNLKRAHPLIDKLESIKIKNISKNLENDNHTIEYKNNNNKLFIKSLLSSLEERKKNKYNSKGNSILISNKNYKKVEILKSNQKIKNDTKLKRTLSTNLKESKKSLKGEFHIKSNKNLLDIENILLNSLNNRNNLSVNNSNKIDGNKVNLFHSIKIKRNYNNKINKNYHLKKYLLRTNKCINESKKIQFPSINEALLKKKYEKKEYLRFLEKKSLALRANFIMNNLQDCRGRKQELRLLYNPLNV